MRFFVEDMKNGEGKYLFLWGRRKKGEGKGGNYLDKEINGDTDRPTNQPGEYSARVRKRENILNSKIFVAKTLRIKRINCVNFQILQILYLDTFHIIRKPSRPVMHMGKLFFSRGGAGRGKAKIYGAARGKGGEHTAFWLIEIICNSKGNLNSNCIIKVK